MNLRRSSLLLSILWLAGCAATEQIAKTEAIESAATKETNSGAGKTETTRAAATTSAIDEGETANAAATAEMAQVLSLSRLLQRMDRVATLEPGSVQQRTQQLDAKFAELDPADRYEFALLLTRKRSTNRALTRAISILSELQEGANDRIGAEILLLHRRYLTLKKQYRSQRNKSIELEKKIERLKGLEQDLDNSNSRMQEPLYPLPGAPRQP
ncbi:MAG: hypothetical protein B6D74_07715 [gamma proteobacterium symbiont of Ctena orbiculata]|nr:MAG: hypothetical protein B6D74_07715 [gamma proteobacterium symbiont of Ctena orbiculata]